MELESIKNEEKFMNLIMFWTNIMIPLVAYAFVMLFLNGERKDAIVLIMVAAAVVTKICERWLGKYAKYIYGCIIPVVGAVTIAFADGGTFHCHDSRIFYGNSYDDTVLQFVSYFG